MGNRMMWRGKVSIIIIVGLLLVVLPAGANAVTMLGTVSGTVTTTNGHVASASTVHFLNYTTGHEVDSAVADANGHYSKTLATGTYSMYADEPDHGMSTIIVVTINSLHPVIKNFTIATLPYTLNVATSKSSVLANGMDTITITSTVTDAYGQPPGDCSQNFLSYTIITPDEYHWQTMGSVSQNNQNSQHQSIRGGYPIAPTSSIVYGWIESTTTLDTIPITVSLIWDGQDHTSVIVTKTVNVAIVKDAGATPTSDTTPPTPVVTPPAGPTPNSVVTPVVTPPADVTPATQGTPVTPTPGAQGQQTTPPVTVTPGAVTPVPGSTTDTTPPVTNITLAGTQVNGTYTSDVTVTLTATDDGSGVARTEYSYDTANWVNYKGPFTITENGAKTIYARSVDNAGNKESANSVTVTLNKPVTKSALPCLGSLILPLVIVGTVTLRRIKKN